MDVENENENAEPATQGLRERKRQQTRERLTSVALALFLERGFDATTLDDIVAAADISRRTFFHYFASKEDLVFAWQDSFDDDLTEAVLARPAAEPPLRAAINALVAIFSQLPPEKMRVQGELMKNTPALRAREQVKYERLEGKLAKMLSGRMGVDATALEPRLIAMIAIGTLRVASRAWLEVGGDVDHITYAQQVQDILRREITAE